MDESGGSGSLSNYKLGRIVGKVQVAQHIPTGIQVAIARESISDSDWGTMRLISHPHVVKIYEVIVTQPTTYLIMEYINFGNLLDYINAKGRLAEDKARRFFQQIISGVESCHLHKLVRQDLKLENLLVDSKGNVKIGHLMRGGHLPQTSPKYAAPEVISGHPHAGPEVDVWSCEVILHALLTGGLPFDDETTSVLLWNIKHGVFTCPHYLSLEARDLIMRMLMVDPVNRISIPEIYKHPWFQINIPPYIADRSIISSWSARKVDDRVLEEMGIMGFNVQEVTKYLNNMSQNQATVSHSILLHRRLNEDVLGSLVSA